MPEECSNCGCWLYPNNDIHCCARCGAIFCEDCSCKKIRWVPSKKHKDVHERVCEVCRDG